MLRNNSNVLLLILYIGSEYSSINKYKKGINKITIETYSFLIK